MNDYLFIVNPNARNGKVGEKWTEVEKIIRASNIDYEVVFSEYHLHALELANAAAGKYKAVIAVGGDGTVHEVANGLYGSSTALGLLPLGNGNDYSHLLRYSKNIKENVDILKKRETIELNVGMVESDTKDKRYFINIAEVGITSLISQDAFTKAKWLKGLVKYYFLALKRLISYKNVPATVTIDNKEVFSSPMVLCAVGLGYRFGGGFKVLPDNNPLAGDFAICIGGDISVIKKIYLMNLLKDGKHLGKKDIYYLRGKEIIIELEKPMPGEAEGEIFTEAGTRFEFKMAPKTIPVIVNLPRFLAKYKKQES